MILQYLAHISSCTFLSLTPGVVLTREDLNPPFPSGNILMSVMQSEKVILMCTMEVGDPTIWNLQSFLSPKAFSSFILMPSMITYDLRASATFCSVPSRNSFIAFSWSMTCSYLSTDAPLMIASTSIMATVYA